MYMEKLIKKVLLEYVKKLDELDKTKHVDERAKDRLLKAEYYVAELRYKDEKGFTVSEDIGTYTLPEKFISVIENRISWLHTSFEFRDNDRYGIVLGRIKINLDKIDYYYPEEKDKIKEKLEKRNGVIYLKTDYEDQDTNSTGNIVFVIVAENKMITLLFERSLEFSNVTQKRDLKKVFDFEELIQSRL